MPFSLTSEQEAFRDTLESFFNQHFGPETIRKREEDRSISLWSELHSLGLEEAFVGPDASCGSIELALLSSLCGRCLVSERIAEHLLVQQVLGSGAFVGALSFGNLAPINPKADKLLIIENNAIYEGQFVAEPYRSLELTIDLIGVISTDKALPIDPLKLESGASLCRAAELSGVLSRVLATTIEYVSLREQFGVPIGGFQAVQHRLADIASRAESLRAMVRFAAWARDNDPQQALMAARSALCYARAHVVSGVEAALQLQGGIAFTWEHDLHLYLRRALLLSGLVPEGLSLSLVSDQSFI